VTTFHDLRVPYLFPKAGALRGWITFELARASDAVIATNEEDYAQLAQQFGPRVSLIPIGSNIEPAPPPDYSREAWRARLGVAPGELLLSYFGFLNDSKGGETLIRALAEIPEAKLLMIGGQVGASDPTNVAYLAQVKNLIADLGLNSRVQWTDYTPQEQVSAHFLASDICVLPYRDGASFRRGSFMAALAQGMPIVTTTSRTGTGVRTSLPKLVDGENVLLVPPDEPRALAEAIAHLAAEPDLYVRLRHGARELASFFTWEKIAAQHLELYERLARINSHHTARA
jgi:glycosyltransferase involved in cell wall biosynthesis